jgi:hypothetical protein
MSSKNIYYVYAYLRSKDSKTASAGTPYYIGKGQGRRARCKSHSVPVPTDNKNIVFLERNLSNIGACALERRMIRWYGRKDHGTGILLNRTNGGEGAPGSTSWLKGKTQSAETKKKISDAGKGRPVSEYTRKKISAAQKGKPRKLHSEETRIKMSKSQRLRAPDSEATRKKKSEAMIGKPAPNKGIPMSEKQKQKLRKPKPPRTEEHKRKLGDSVRRAAELRRAAALVTQEIHM